MTPKMGTSVWGSNALGGWEMERVCGQRVSQRDLGESSESRGSPWKTLDMGGRKKPGERYHISLEKVGDSKSHLKTSELGNGMEGLQSCDALVGAT
jgi:hypothetical protein